VRPRPGAGVPAGALAGGLIRLRPVGEGLAPGDWEALHRQARDPVVCDLNGYPPTPYPLWMFRWLITADTRRSDRRVWAIMTSAPAQSCLGLVELYEIDPRTGRAVLGIVIGVRERWGQGLGKTAVGLVCGFGFECLGLVEIRLSTFVHNLRARRCFERVGFIESGRGPGLGGRQDVHMCLTRSRWLAIGTGEAQPVGSAGPPGPPSSPGRTRVASGGPSETRGREP